MNYQRTNASPRIRVIKEAVLGRSEKIQFSILTALSLLAMTAFLLAWVRLEAWKDDPVMISVLSMIVLVILGNAYGRWLLLPQMKKPRTVEARSGWKVGVVTTFVPDVEPFYLLENTLKALVALDYLHETWVLDEGDDDRVKELCIKEGAFHFSRKHRPQYQTETGLFRKATKYGNYNAWLHEVGFQRYDTIATFDPDHVPERTFLVKVLGYFNDPTIGYVQAPQVYSNQDSSFIARGAAEESYTFYSSTQMASYGLGYPIIVGCHTTHRISALQEVDGFAQHDADDLLLTLLYRNRGWEGVYVPEVLARGLAPTEWETYLTQQRRWARALLDIKLKIAPSLLSNLSFFPRSMSLLHGLHYLHTGFLFPTIFLLIMVMLIQGKVPNVLEAGTVISGGVLFVMLQVCNRYGQQFFLNLEWERVLHWRAAILQWAKWPYLLMAFFDVVFARRFPYRVTAKTAGATRASFALWPHLLVLVMIGLAWGIGLSSNGTVPVEVQICAGTVLLGNFFLLTTEWCGVVPSPSES